MHVLLYVNYLLISTVVASRVGQCYDIIIYHDIKVSR